MTVNFIRNLAAQLGFLTPASAGDIHAQEPTNFPNRPMRIITGYLPGGVSDTVARTIATQLGEQLNQRIIIDSRPGAGGTLAMEIAGGTRAPSLP